jgi:hypothetical protein
MFINHHKSSYIIIIHHNSSQFNHVHQSSLLFYGINFLSLNSAVSFPKRVPQTSGWHSCGTLPRFRPWPIEPGSLGWKDLRSEALSKGLSLVLQVNLMSL